jgi:adenylate kinase
MKTVLVVGDSESGKDDIIELALKRVKSGLPEYGYLKFDEDLTKGVYEHYNSGLADIRKFRTEFQKKAVEKFNGLRKDHGNMVINARFFVSLRHGFVSVLDKGMFEAFKPDAIIIIELNPKKFNPKFRPMFKEKEPINLRELRLEQDMIRKYAALYASSSDCILRFIQVEKENVNNAFKEVTDIMKFTLGGK